MISRSFALFVSLLTVLNLGGDLILPGFDASFWWIHFGGHGKWWSQLILGASALALMQFALRPPCGRGKAHRTAAALAFALGCFSLANTAAFYWLALTGRIDAAVPVPLSLLISAGLFNIAHSAWVPALPAVRLGRWPVLAGCAVLFGSFPLALMLFFGNTDYRRTADAAVVFGARAYSDGRLSDALKDRIRTGCELYSKGLVKRLVLSGGPGDGPITEATAMRNYAVSHGVRAEDIHVDDAGLNTDATVRNTAPLFRQWGSKRVLAVSHFYHLPRIKLAYQRAGVEVCTVPARQSYVLRQIPYSVAREVAAFWVYYFTSLPAAA